MLIRSLLASTAIVLALGATAPTVSAEDATTVAAGADLDNRRAEMNSAMETWHARVEERRAGTEGSDDTLDAAWNEVASAWNDVEAATAENWDDASDTFDRAMADLEETWDEVTDDDPNT